MIAGAVALGACAQLAPLAMVAQSAPLLSVALASRGGEATSRRIAELENRKDWAGLAALARERLQKTPADPDWTLILGYTQVRQGEFAQAIESFSRVTEKRPEDADAWNMLGESQRLAGHPDQAVATLERAATIHSHSPVTRFLLGQACRDAGRLPQAISAYREAIRLEPDYAPGWFGLGSALLRMGQGEELPRIAERLQTLDPALAQELARLRRGE